ncbi:uridine diphosphate glucose pyrophosphatase NUDT14 isoform X1 [Stegostoma tigrinum]|uniref:uridine diphosphate glucose pyrophosphatase NUDT14 isoform X1 n=1 Tax=Stegostoma tigrinum TaxID=3053191 RepID=UPI0028702A4B|nr:uridine diphosphate glucose pyrophosphatase NUDT14 isoform X1 [Stegostoma tigrinum]
MDEVEDVEIGPCLNSRYLRLQRVHFTQNGARKYWDFMKTHDSVSILIFNTTRECFILVKQFRPAVYMCECARQGMLPDDETTADDSSQLGKLLPASAGITYELCSGIVDKPGLSLQQIAKEEVLEECGYDVPVESLQKITSYRSGVGVTGSKHTMFYVEVSDDLHIGPGGGQADEGELIEVIHLPVKDWQTFVFDECIPKTAGVSFAFMWFHSSNAPRLQASKCRVSPSC